MAPELANLRGRETVIGSVSAAKSAKSMEASPRKPDLDDPCRNPEGLRLERTPAETHSKGEKETRFWVVHTVETMKW